MKSGILYRLNQKFKYHITNDLFHKAVAEINRNGELLTIDGDSFRIKGVSLIFRKEKHAFILQNFKVFDQLSKTDYLDFQIINEELFCKVDDLTIAVTTAEEIFIIKEIWVDGTYNLDINSTSKFIVMDVGMNVGMASLFFSNKPFVERVYAYEPFEPTFESAKLNIQNNKQLQNKIAINNLGLSSKDEEIEVDYSPEHRGRTGVWGTDLVLDHIENPQKEKLKLVNFNVELKRLIQEHPQREFILKIDCEGSEYDIFKSINEELLHPVRFILLEWHKNGPEEIVEKLKKNGFTTLSFNPKSSKVGMLYAFK